jgi:UDP-N-acetylglucosamine 2-epimerase
VRRLAERQDVAAIFPVHLNPDVRAVMNQRLAGDDSVALIEPPDYPHFARLLDISMLMLTDSGGVQEEARARKAGAGHARDRRAARGDRGRHRPAGRPDADFLP